MMLTNKLQTARLLVTLIIVILLLLLMNIQVLAAEPSEWASEEIEAAIIRNATTEALMKDYQGTLTRDAFIELLVKTYESVTDEVVDVSTVKNPFTDTNQLYVTKAYEVGISKGTTSTTFSPDDLVSREQMVVLFVRMVEAVEVKRNFIILEAVTNDTTFEDDANISPYAKEAIYKALANGIIAGDGVNEMNPKDLSTSEQALIINYRLLNRIVDTGKISIMWRLNLLNYEEEVRVVAERDLGQYMDSDQKAFVTADVLNMRSEPLIDEEGDNIVRRLQAYEEVVILEEVKGWYRIAATGEIEGYVHSDYIHAYSPDDNLGDIRMQIVDYAKQFIGTPYVYAGNSLTGGIDCSAYTKQVIRPFGYVLDRSSSGQGNDGVVISEKDLLPGDLVFYGYSSKISHVALYIGRGEVIHATTSSGVKVTDMEGYMYKPVISYRRVIF